MSPGPRAERAALALAAASAVTAYLTAHVAPGGVGTLVAGGLSALIVLPSLVRQWTGVPPGLVRPVRLGLVGLLVAAFLLTVLSRQLPALPEDQAQRWAILIGGVLSCLVLLFLYASGAWGVPRGTLPAIAGTLSVAALNERSHAFLVLASISGGALWTHAVLTGGPRRRGRALALFALGGVALAGGTVLFLPWAEPHVTRFVAQAYSDGQTGLSDSSELGEVERLALSRRVVAHVWTSRPQRLRMQVFDDFDGHRWSVGRASPRSLEALPDEGTAGLGPLLRTVPGRTFLVDATDPSSASVETRVVPVLAFDDGWGLLVPASSAVLRLPGTAVTVDGLGRVFLPAGFPLVYGVAGLHGGPAPGRSDPSPADLQLPSPLDPGVRRLAEQLSQRGGYDEERLRRTVDLLQSRPYRYTLDVGSFKTGDPVAEFLLRKKAGYCEYFASAAVLLLRLQGIPARYVKGVTVRPESLVGGHYLVRESDAHAWVEAYLSGVGWVEDDPTPPRDYAAVHDDPRPGPIEEGWEALRARVAVAWATLRQGGWAQVSARIADVARRFLAALTDHPWIAALFLFILLAVTGGMRRLSRLVASWLGRRRRGFVPGVGVPSVPSELRHLMQLVERYWSRRGHARPPSSGFREHLDSLPGQVLTPTEREVSRAVVESYYRASFGSEAPSSSDLAELAVRVAMLR